MGKSFIVIVVIILASCVTPEGMKSVKNNDRVVYALPSEGVEEGSFSGVRFDVRPYECVRSGYKYLRDTKLVPQEDGRCAVNFMTFIEATGKNGRLSPQVAYDSYLFAVKKRSAKGVTTLTFKPLYEGLHPYRNFGSSTISPPHSVENALEVIATSGILTFQFEVDSPLSQPAVLKRFAKYFRQRSHPGQPVTVMKKSFASSYLLMVSGNPLATFYLSTQPLRSGTRVSVITRLHLAPDDNYHVDAVGQASDIRKVVADAVNAAAASN